MTLVVDRPDDYLQPHALRLPPRLAFEDWEQIGEFIRRAEGSVYWWLGDWCNYGELAYGEKYSQAIDATGYDYQTLADAAWVASRFHPSRRRENLQWHHHRTVASLDPEAQDALLDAAGAHNLTRQQFRAAVKAYKAGDDANALFYAARQPTLDKLPSPWDRPGASESPEDTARALVPIPGAQGALEVVSDPGPTPSVLLVAIRVALGVQTNDEILPAIANLKAAVPVAVEAEIGPDDDPAKWMHALWQQELGNGHTLSLTKSRREKYRAMYREQLKGSPNPQLAFRAVLRAVTRSEHHMSNRDYQLPESLFRGPDRRDKWVARTVDLIESATKKSTEAADFAAYYRSRHG